MRHYEENVLSSEKAFFILNDIRTNGSSYSTEIAETYNMNRPMVTEILNSLQGKNILEVDETQEKPGKHFKVNYKGLVDTFIELWAKEYDITLDNISFTEFLQKRFSQIENQLEKGFEEITEEIDLEIEKDDALKQGTLGQIRRNRANMDSYNQFTARTYVRSYVKNYLKYSITEYEDNESTSIKKMLVSDFQKDIQNTKLSLNELPSPISKMHKAVQKRERDENHIFDDLGVKALADILEARIDESDVEEIELVLLADPLYKNKKHSGITRRYISEDAEKQFEAPFRLKCCLCKDYFTSKENLNTKLTCSCRSINMDSLLGIVPYLVG